MQSVFKAMRLDEMTLEGEREERDSFYSKAAFALSIQREPINPFS